MTWLVFRNGCAPAALGGGVAASNRRRISDTYTNTVADQIADHVDADDEPDCFADHVDPDCKSNTFADLFADHVDTNCFADHIDTDYFTDHDEPVGEPDAVPVRRPGIRGVQHARPRHVLDVVNVWMGWRFVCELRQ